MSQITDCIVHCSDSSWGCMREIDVWHKQRGWSGCGYHFVIDNGKPTDSIFYLEPLDGAIECGRRIDGDGNIEPDEIGMHTLGFNNKSIGICLIGKTVNGNMSFTLRQFDALKALLLAVCHHYKIPPENVLGHYETANGKAQGKTCPDFNMAPFRAWLQSRMA